MPGKDPRLAELELLTRVARGTEVTQAELADLPHRQMIMHLLVEDLLNDGTTAFASEQGWSSAQQGSHARAEFITQRDEDKWRTFYYVARGQPNVMLTLGHRGRLRIAELRDTLKAVRRLEKHGVLFDGAHWRTDIGAALTMASAESPVSLVVFDANGMKYINEKYGHPAGDEFLKAYFRVVKSSFGDAGDTYCHGGDEVGVICAGMELAKTAARARACLVELQSTEVKYDGTVLTPGITAAAGVADARAPDFGAEALVKAADDAEGKAKQRSRAGKKRTAQLCVARGEPELVPSDQ